MKFPSQSSQFKKRRKEIPIILQNPPTMIPYKKNYLVQHDYRASKPLYELQLQQTVIEITVFPWFSMT